MIKAILGQPNNGLRRFNSKMIWTTSSDGPFGPGLLLDRRD
jgi:hypothetical protein